MKEQIVEFETAKLAKKMGFDWTCRSFYYEVDEKEPAFEPISAGNFNDKNAYADTISAPTQSLLHKWLRDVHNCCVQVTKIHKTNYRPSVKYTFQHSDIKYNSFEEATENAIVFFLKKLW